MRDHIQGFFVIDETKMDVFGIFSVLLNDHFKVQVQVVLVPISGLKPACLSLSSSFSFDFILFALILSKILLIWLKRAIVPLLMHT